MRLMFCPNFLEILAILQYPQFSNYCVFILYGIIVPYDSGEAKPKISFPFFVCSPPPPPPRKKKKKGKKIFWFLPRRPRGADEARRLERTIQFRVTTRSARAISSFRQGSSRNAVELCPIHTAKIRNQKKRTRRGRANGWTLMHFPRRIQNPKGFSTLRVARRLPIQFYE